MLVIAWGAGDSNKLLELFWWQNFLCKMFSVYFASNVTFESLCIPENYLCVLCELMHIGFYLPSQSGSRRGES